MLSVLSARLTNKRTGQRQIFDLPLVKHIVHIVDAPVTAYKYHGNIHLFGNGKCEFLEIRFIHPCLDTAHRCAVSADLDAVKIRRTGKNTVLAQHFTMSFKPVEITPERALEVGKELCEKYLKKEYQYYLTVHTAGLSETGNRALQSAQVQFDQL